MKRSLSGQEAMEFALIGGLVFCVAIGTTLLFGKKIASFFHSESAVATVANATPNVHSSDSGENYSPDFETYAANPEKPAAPAEGGATTEVTIGGITITNIPENTGSTIKTSGASGVTDLISSSISDLASQLQALADSDPSNTQLQSLVNKTKLLAETGHIIADSEEWIEAASMRYTSNEEIVFSEIFEGNTLREGGESYSGDNTLQNKDFLFNTKDNFLLPTLSKYTNDFIAINSQIESLASTQSEEVQAITQIVSQLSGDINDISGHVGDIVDNASNSEFGGLDYLNSQVASQTTDIKSDLIESQASKEEVLETSTETTAQ